MLEDIATNIFESPTYHFANLPRHVDVLLEMQINADGISDMLSLLRERDRKRQEAIRQAKDEYARRYAEGAKKASAICEKVKP